MAEISKTVDQAMAVLENLGARGPATVLELSRRVSLNRTVAHRLLATLETRQFVQRHDDGRYRLGSAMLGLGSQVELPLRAAARPALEQLAETFAETAVLSVPDGDDAVAVEQVPARERMVRVDYRPGFRHSLGVAAHGLAILAFSPERAVQRVLAAAANASALTASLHKVRERGYAVTHDELQFGASGLAAPVLDSAGRAIGSLGIVAPVNRFPEEAAAAVATCAAAASTGERLAPGRQG